MLNPLTGNYTYRELATDEFVPLFKQYRQQVFASELHFDLNAPLDADELQRFGKLVKNMGTPYRLHIGIYHDSEFVGWTTGWQRATDAALHGKQRHFTCSSGQRHLYSAPAHCHRQTARQRVSDHL